LNKLIKIDIKQHIDIVERKMGNCSDRISISEHESYKKIIPYGKGKKRRNQEKKQKELDQEQQKNF
jgi:hypothetical protein